MNRLASRQPVFVFYREDRDDDAAEKSKGPSPLAKGS